MINLLLNRLVHFLYYLDIAKIEYKTDYTYLTDEDAYGNTYVRDDETCFSITIYSKNKYKISLDFHVEKEDEQITEGCSGDIILITFNDFKNFEVFIMKDNQSVKEIVELIKTYMAAHGDPKYSVILPPKETAKNWKDTIKQFFKK